jgi:hypothetical protein
MLVSHGAVEAPLRRLVARCRKMNSSEALIAFFLT